MDKKKDAFNLFLISYLTLYFEILFIRWLASELRIFAYFNNSILIACFLGMGLGVFISGKRRDLFSWFLPILALIVLSIYISPEKARLDLVPSGEEIDFWGFFSAKPGLYHARKFFAIIIGYFVLTVLAFIPLGQKIGIYMGRQKPLAAYSINIFGSLVGIGVFTLFSVWELVPAWWFFFGLIGVVYFYRASSIKIAAALFFTIAIPLFIFLRAEKAYWSPYQKLTLKPNMVESSGGELERAGYILDVNKDFYQTASDLRKESVKKFPSLGPLKSFYEKPYRIAKPKDVLIVGSGMGNDIAAALRTGVERVDAVEIDPRIVALGRVYHPEKPYDSPRVNVFVNDARSYFTNASKKYDLIVFSLLDSHVVLSSRTSLRLDNYVYTLESFRQASSLLKENGTISLSFAVRRTWMKSRFYGMFEDVFGHPPVQVANSVFMIGKDPGFPSPEIGIDEDMDPAAIRTTDDWPYLYTMNKKIPKIYLYVLGLMAFISLGFVTASVPGSLRRIEWHFFFLGAAFMLIEVRSITQMALLFGSTWVVSSLVIAGVLFMILVANLLVHLRPGIPTILPYILLCGLLIIVYVFPFESFLRMNFVLRAVMSTLLLTLPLFFAGIIFAISFKDTPDITVAFASNLIGAILGGLFEYSCFVFGLRTLCLFSLLFYVLSFLALLLRGKPAMLTTGSTK